MNQDKRKSKVLIYAGAFMAILIGSGFATGQELIQFFAAFGLEGTWGIVISFVLFAFVGVEFVTYGRRSELKNPNDVYKDIEGDKLGTFYDYFSVFFLFLSFVVMVAGADATIEYQYQAPNYLGGIGLGLVTIITVVFGLKTMVDIIGKIGPLIVILSIIVGAISIVQNASQFQISIQSLENLSQNG